MQYMLMEMRDRNKEVMEAVEDSVGAGRGMEAGMKWMKNPQHWKQGQQYAHFILVMTNRMVANVMIREGVVINGQRLRVRKLEADPRRCFKCQFLGRGHTVENCKDSLEQCGMCALSTHTTAKCPVRDLAKFICMNCRHERRNCNHASWDRMCLVFLRHKDNLMEGQPDTRYKYYPGDEEWTWVQNQDGEEAKLNYWRGNLQHGAYKERGHRDDGWGGKLEVGTMGDIRVQQARNMQGAVTVQGSQPARALSKTRGPDTAPAATNRSQVRRPESHNKGVARSRTSSQARAMPSDQQTKVTDWFTSAEVERERAQVDRDLYGGSMQVLHNSNK